jgi:hypothetical protein
MPSWHGARYVRCVLNHPGTHSRSEYAVGTRASILRHCKTRVAGPDHITRNHTLLIYPASYLPPNNREFTEVLLVPNLWVGLVLLCGVHQPSDGVGRCCLGAECRKTFQMQNAICIVCFSCKKPGKNVLVAFLLFGHLMSVSMNECIGCFF